jgi:hypothetical protein
MAATMPQRRRQKDGREIGEQLMRVFAPGNRVQQMDERVERKEGCGGQRCRSRQAIDRKPHKRRSGDEIRNADVADEMRIERTGFRNARNRVVPACRHGEHNQSIRRQADPERPRHNPAHTNRLLSHKTR